VLVIDECVDAGLADRGCRGGSLEDIILDGQR